MGLGEAGADDHKDEEGHNAAGHGFFLSRSQQNML